MRVTASPRKNLTATSVSHRPRSQRLERCLIALLPPSKPLPADADDSPSPGQSDGLIVIIRKRLSAGAPSR